MESIRSAIGNAFRIVIAVQDCWPTPNQARIGSEFYQNLTRTCFDSRIIESQLTQVPTKIVPESTQNPPNTPKNHLHLRWGLRPPSPPPLPPPSPQSPLFPPPVCKRYRPTPNQSRSKLESYQSLGRVDRLGASQNTPEI